MKQKLVNYALIFTSMLALTACPQKKSEDNHPAGPQGRITGYSGDSSYCDLANGTISCTIVNKMNNMLMCNSNVKRYDPQNVASLCEQIRDLQNESLIPGACNVRGVVDRIFAENCTGVAIPPATGQNFPGGPNNPNNPSLPGGPDSFKGFLCEMEAYRGNYYIPKTTFSLVAAPHRLTTIKFKSQGDPLLVGFLKKLLRMGKTPSVGDISLTYRPAGPAAGAVDTLTLANSGLKTSKDLYVNVSQTGFAGSQVSLQTMNDDLMVSVSCKANFGYPNAAPGIPAKTNLVCRGKSKSAVEDEQEIEKIFPLNSISNGEEFQISSSISAKLNGTTSITYNVTVDPEFGPTVTSTSSLSAPASVKAKEVGEYGLADVNLSCELK